MNINSLNNSQNFGVQHNSKTNNAVINTNFEVKETIELPQKQIVNAQTVLANYTGPKINMSFKGNIQNEEMRDEELEKLKSNLKTRLETLNVSTALHCFEDDNERFGVDGISDILKYATSKENIDIINKKLDGLEQGEQVWTYDITKLFKFRFQSKESPISSSPLGAQIVGPIKELCLNKSIKPNVIELEEKMKKMGYIANFSDNEETAKIITNAYENLTKKGFKMPEEILLMIPQKEGILGFRPYAKKGNEFKTPILYSKNLNQKREEKIPSFLADIGIKFNSSNTPESVVYHEIGHFLHELNEPDIEHSCQVWKNLANDGYDIDLAKEVGFYAMTGDKFHMGREFVAEVFAGLIEGKQYSERVMNLYKELNGPMVR